MARIYQDNADSLAIAEALEGASNIGFSLTDDIVLQDSLASISEYKLELADIETILEGIFEGLVVNLTDALVIAESVTEVPALGWFGADSIAISEAIQSIVTFHLELSDSQTIIESFSKALVFKISLTDAQVITESVIEYDINEEVWWAMIKSACCVHAGI